MLRAGRLGANSKQTESIFGMALSQPNFGIIPRKQLGEF